MMKMMKKFYINRFNESQGDECSFEDFKKIMLFDILDDFDFEYSFNDEGYFFECIIDMSGPEKYELHDDIPDMNVDFLSYNREEILPCFDAGEELNDEYLDSAIDSISDNIDELKELKSELNTIVKYQENCQDVFRRLKKIKDRFEDFSNFSYAEIGFQQGELLISFVTNDRQL
jgi:hypothetical protein